MSEVARQFGENLVRHRGRLGISQEEVGLRASLHRTEISLLERGTRVPRIDTLAKLAGALDIKPEALLKGIVWRPGEAVAGNFIETEVPGLGTVHRRFEAERRGHGR